MNGYNILFLAPRVPYPLDTGAKIRTYNLLSYMASRHRVTLLCFQWNPDDEQYRAVLERIVSRLCEMCLHDFPDFPDEDYRKQHMR